MSATERDPLSPALRAFDALAARFDERFGAWRSVAAQRAAVRRELLRAFPPGASLLELGGGTGEDALFLAERGYRVHLTDGSDAMLARSSEKVRAAGATDRIRLSRVALEELGRFADEREAAGTPPFDGCFSNFAAFNCVEEITGPAGALARLLAPGTRALLVIFGPFCPGEVLTLLLRGEPRSALRRFGRRTVQARLGGNSFTVTYHTPSALARAFAPWFARRRTRGIGVFVPPSSAEPWISGRPRLLSALESLDRAAAVPLALLGDHVLVELERTRVPA